MGSVGVGCTVHEGVKVAVKKSHAINVIFNQKRLIFPTVSSVIKKLTQLPITARITSPLPLAYGFGVSGASALATAFALNDFLKLSYKPSQLVGIAHVAEVENRTGLGSVATQSTGGFLLKVKPGIPTQVKHLPFIGRKLFATVINRIETPSILNNTHVLTRVNGQAQKALESISRQLPVTLAEILDTAHVFAQNSGLLTQKAARVIDVIRSDGGHASMAMIGEVVLSDKKPICDYPIRELTITNETVHRL